MTSEMNIVCSGGAQNIVVVYPHKTINLIVDNLNEFKKQKIKLSFSKFINKLFEQLNLADGKIYTNKTKLSFFFTDKQKNLLERMIAENEPITIFLKKIRSLVFNSKIKHISEDEVVKSFLRFIFYKYPNYKCYKRQKTKYKKVQYKKYGIETKQKSVYFNKKTISILSYLSEKYEASISEIVNIAIAKAFNLNIFKKIIQSNKSVDWTGLIEEMYGINLDEVFETKANKLIDSPIFKNNENKIGKILYNQHRYGNKNGFIDTLSLAIFFKIGKSVSILQIKEEVSKIVKKYWNDIGAKLIDYYEEE